MVEAELLIVAAGAADREIDADHGHFLGAGEQPRVGRAARARRDGLRRRQIIGLVGVHAAAFGRGKAGADLCVGVGQQRRRPVFVGDAEPDIGGVPALALLVVDLLVGLVLQALVADHADQAFMQNVIALHLRRAVARDQRIGKQRDRVAALVRHLVFQGEQITVVDRDGAAEDQARAVVVGQRHRMVDAERARALLLPHRVRPRHRRGGAGGGHPAELGVERLRRARRREQHDGRRVRIDGLAIVLERQIVDPAALEIDAAAQRRRGDGDARRSGNHRVARCGRDRGRGGAGHRRRRAGAGACARRGARLRRIRLRRAGLGLRLFLLLEQRLLALLFHLRIADEILPADHDDQRQHDGNDGVLVIAHSMLVHCGFWRGRRFAGRGELG